MNLRFTHGIAKSRKETDAGIVMPLSKATNVTNAEFNNVIQIIDESGNEINCTIDKFIEIFDYHGLEGFIL